MFWLSVSRSLNTESRGILPSSLRMVVCTREAYGAEVSRRAAEKGREWNAHSKAARQGPVAASGRTGAHLRQLCHRVHRILHAVRGAECVHHLCWGGERHQVVSTLTTKPRQTLGGDALVRLLVLPFLTCADNHIC